MMFTTNSATTTFADSKYTVADILSSMANGGGPLTPTSFSDPTPNPYVSSISGTGTTPTLTPTTLASIERTFMELGAAASNSLPQDLSRQSGFVPPVVNPVLTNGAMKPEYDYYYDGSDDMSRDSSDTDDWKSEHGGKKARMDHGAHGGVPTTLNNAQPTSNRGGARRRRLKDDQLPPEESEKRRVRRERNKLAAAKCRQRRVDHTNVLINQTEALEEEKSGLEDEIQSLQQQKEQLEFLLEAHKPLCNAKVDSCVTVIHIKPEDHEGAPCSSAASAISTTTASSRPTSLAIGSRAHAASGASAAALPFGQSSTAATGVPISTPSNGVFTLGFNSLADGHTSLTPITGVPSCGADTQRSLRENSPNEGTVTSPTTLMAL